MSINRTCEVNLGGGSSSDSLQMVVIEGGEWIAGGVLTR